MTPTSVGRTNGRHGHVIGAWVLKMKKPGGFAGARSNHISRCGSEWAWLGQRRWCQKRKCVSADLSLSFGHGRFQERGSYRRSHGNQLAP